MGIPKLFILLAALFLFSGCCQFLGICTSASVHTSISPSDQYVQQNNSPDYLLASQSPQSWAQ